MGSTWTPAEWERYLARELDRPVRVAFGRSRSVPVQARTEPLDGRDGLAVRMHRMFADAPDGVRADLARWLRVGRRARRACGRLDAWIEASLAGLPRTARTVRLEPAGQSHDLAALARPLYSTCFGQDFQDRPRPALSWGRRGRSSSRRSLRLGTYDPEANLVRVHPVLDQPAVPSWFVRFVLMHEILHAVLPPRPGRGRRWVHHGAEFRRREAAYPDHARAQRWEERNLGRLIRSARNGTPFRPVREGLAGRVQGLLFE